MPFIRFAAVLLSAVLLISAFPPYRSTEAAWLALVPLLMVLRPGFCTRPFWVGYVFGLLYWGVSLCWLRHVTWFGWWLLASYCALYPAGFAWLLFAYWKRNGDETFLTRLRWMFVVVLFWTGVEVLRGWVGTGFPWNFIGVSQFERSSLIQVCAIGGVHFLGALVVFFNAAMAMTLLRYFRMARDGNRHRNAELLLALALVLIASLYGFRRIQHASPASRQARIALVQPDVPQYQKWTREFVTDIYRKLWVWSSTAVRVEGLDLIVWPETAVPDDLLDSEVSMNLVQDLLTNGVPLLAGSMDIAWRDEGEPDYFNSTFLFDSDGRIAGRYDKQHLVMFGEYVPFYRTLGWVKTLSPLEASLTAGKDTGLMKLSSGIEFAPLICFEDVMAGLARKAVSEGARLIVNQTNDAWFDPSAGSRQHFCNALFRSVENGVPMVRCCNTGVTGLIDRFGRIHQTLKDGEGNVQIEGFLTVQVPVPGDEFTPTIYTRYGDVFGVSSAILVIGCGLFYGLLGMRNRDAARKEVRG